MKLTELYESDVYISNEQWKRELSNNYYPDGKTRAVVVSMTPDDFLYLTPEDPSIENRAASYGEFDANQYTSDWLPHLDIDKSGKVLDHEGRARMYMAKQSGVKIMPVLIRFSKVDRVGDISEVPKVLTQQEGTGKINISIVGLVTYGVDNTWVK